MHAILVFSVVLAGLALATPVAEKADLDLSGVSLAKDHPDVPDGCIANPGVSINVLIA